MIFNPSDVGWHLGRAQEPRGGPLWVPWDRTTGVIGPQGSGKTLDLLIPALLHAPGAALVTLTKVDDLLLSFPVRSRDGRPCLVLDPFGLAAGLPELVWDPIAGCVDPMVAERRAKAFTAGTIKAASGGGYGDDAARFYAATFPDSKVTSVHKAPADFPGGKQGDVLTVEFTVLGIPCLGLNGGPAFRQTEAFSFQVATDDQAETDRYWNAIVGNGGQESQCGWCRDKWGVSWQITPVQLTEAIADKDPVAAKRAFGAMMGMKKIDIAAIEKARRGA